MSEQVGERMTRLETLHAAHTEICSERYGRIERDASEIKQAVRDLNANITEATRRVHKRIEEERDAAGQRIEALAAQLVAAREEVTREGSGLLVKGLWGAIVALVMMTGYLLINGAPWHHPGA